MLVFAKHGWPLQQLCDRRECHYLTLVNRKGHTTKSTYWINVNKIDPELAF